MHHSDPTLCWTDTISITFHFQKKECKNTIMQWWTGDLIMCPVHHWATIIHWIWHYLGTSDSITINTILVNSKLKCLESLELFINIPAAIGAIWPWPIWAWPHHWWSGPSLPVQHCHNGHAPCKGSGLPHYAHWSMEQQGLPPVHSKTGPRAGSHHSQGMTQRDSFFTVPSMSHNRLPPISTYAITLS